MRRFAIVLAGKLAGDLEVHCAIRMFDDVAGTAMGQYRCVNNCVHFYPSKVEPDISV